jgi:hypothetical protein
MMTPLVHVTLPDLDSNDVEAHFAPLVFMLEGLIKLNEWHLTRNHNRAGRGQEELIPPILASGVYYQEDKPGREDWRDAPAIWDRFKRTGMGADCDQIICWRAGELRVAGIAAEPVIKWQHLTKAEASSLGYASIVPEDGLWLVHCCVRFPDGSIEDTSKILGMGGNFTNKS